MTELFGSFVTPLDEAPGFAVIIGSAFANVFVLPSPEGGARSVFSSLVGCAYLHTQPSTPRRGAHGAR